MRNATVRSAPVLSVLEPAWLEGEFITTVHKGQKARHGDHRSAQALIGHVGGRGDRGPPARLDQGHQRPRGLDGYLWIKGTATAGRYRWLSSSPTERRASIALHLTRSCRDVGKTVVCYKANGGPSPRGPNVSEIRLRKSQLDYIPSFLLPPCPPSIYPSTKAGQQPRDISGEVGRDERG